MRILYVSFDDIGSEYAWSVHVKEIVNGLARRGHEVLVVAPGRTAPDDLEGSFVPMRVPGSRLARVFFHLVGSLWEILRAARGFRPDAIYCRGIHLSITPPLAARFLGCAYVVEVNGLLEFELGDSPMRPLVRFAHKETLSLANRAVAISEPIKRALVEEYGGRDDRVVVVQNGANVERFQPRDQAEARARLGLPGDARIVVYVGSFYRHHAVDLLVRSVPMLEKEHPNLLLLLLGAGSHREELEREVRDAGIGRFVRFPGPKPHAEIPDWLAAANVCAYLLRDRGGQYDDGFSLKLLEYMAMARAVAVASDKGEVCSFVNDNEIGYAEALTGRGDVDRVSAMLSRLLADPDRCRDFGEAGRKLVVDHFNWDRAAGEVEEVLRSCVAG